MIRLNKDRMENEVPQMRGGLGTTLVSKFLTEEEAHGTGKNFSVNTLPPGASIGWHQHTGEFEIYLILEGEAVVTDQERRQHQLKPGDMMLCDDGESHAIENRGDAPVSFLSLILYC